LLHHVLVIGSSGILRIGLTCALLAQQGHACDDRENEQDNTGEEFRKPVSHVVSLLVPAIELRSLAYCRRGNAQKPSPLGYPHIADPGLKRRTEIGRSENSKPKLQNLELDWLTGRVSSIDWQVFPNKLGQAGWA
jgi:hypothetical protein